MSDKERARREAQRKESNSKESQEAQRAQLQQLRRLLYTREQSAHVLGGVSIATIRRLEAEGLLSLIRLSRSPTAQVFHRADQVHNLAEHGAST
jgi:hypothetical protein